MPYSKEHKNATREKILASAMSLFSTKGFNNVSIDELMTHAGLTRGAFYAHFKNKQMLYSEAIISGAQNGQISREKPQDIELKQWISSLIDNYVSVQHINQELAPCPLAFLISDIANSEAEIQNTYTQIFKGLGEALSNGVSSVLKKNDGPKVENSDVYAALALMIGSVAIGRALNDDQLADEVLQGSRRNALKLLHLD